jgi:hypothetical protein
MRKLVLSAARTALVRVTGMFTSPKERAPVQMDAMPSGKAGGVLSTTSPHLR